MLISWGRIQWKRKELEQRPEAGACLGCFPEGEEGKQQELISERRCWAEAGRASGVWLLLPEN